MKHLINIYELRSTKKGTGINKSENFGDLNDDDYIYCWHSDDTKPKWEKVQIKRNNKGLQYKRYLILYGDEDKFNKSKIVANINDSQEYVRIFCVESELDDAQQFAKRSLTYIEDHCDGSFNNFNAYWKTYFLK